MTGISLAGISEEAAATELAPGVVAVSGAVPLDGIASWAPVLPERYQANTAYLLTEGDEHLLIDTGLRVHWAGIRRRLEERVAPGSRIKVFMTRPEPDAVGNIEKVREVYLMDDTDVMSGGSDTPFDFFATAGGRKGTGDAEGSATPAILRTTGFDLSPDRAVRIIVPKLRFLPSYWPFDVRTRTLFTSDVFTHVDQAEPSGLRVVRDPAELPEDEHIARHLFSKFWWLPGATTAEFVDDLRTIFAGLRPERVAPGYGAVLEGREVVDRHVEAVLRVLVDAQQGRYGIPSILTDASA